MENPFDPHPYNLSSPACIQLSSPACIQRVEGGASGIFDTCASCDGSLTPRHHRKPSRPDHHPAGPAHLLTGATLTGATPVLAGAAPGQSPRHGHRAWREGPSATGTTDQAGGRFAEWKSAL